MTDGDKVFAGSIPKLYDTHLVPLIFEPYATDLASRLRSSQAMLDQAAAVGARRPVEWRQADAMKLPAHIVTIES